MADFQAMFAALDRPIAFQPVFARMTGSINAALFLSQAFYWQKRCKKEWWWKTMEDWQEETCLSRREQETARAKLRELGLIKEQRKGSPAKLFYSVDYTAIGNELAKMAQSDNLSMAESDILKESESANLDRRNQPISYSETTTETTKEESSTLLSAKADDHKRMISIWIAELPGLPKPRGCTDQRRRKLQRQLKEFCQGDLELWRQACQRVAAAPHLCGENDRGWTASLDWVIEPRNLTKILEGNYDARQPVERKPEREGVMGIGKRILQRRGAARDRGDYPALDEHAEKPRSTGQPGSAPVAVLPDGREVPLHGTAPNGGPVDRGEPMVPSSREGLRGRAAPGARPCDAAVREPKRPVAGDQEQLDPDLGEAIGDVVSATTWPS